jgi:DNA primase
VALFTKDSLETLRQRVDLLEVIQPHVELKRSGATYKGLCPFHDEKSPSFTVNKGDSHYHCYGCGAHGDSIQFLIEHQRLAFHDAVETLAQRFGVTLERVEDRAESTGPRKADLKAALDLAVKFYQTMLLHTEEGHLALQYLFQRGLEIDFIQRFHLGWAPKASGLLRKLMHAKQINDEILLTAGLITLREDGHKREFFSDRIVFPIRDATGAAIGFSARKIREETFGGKYINTIETPLFKKSRVLFGLNECRKRVAKEQRAIIVEGQIDALMLIHAGLNLVVAGLGTAFGEGHVTELVNLGVKRAYLALDADRAGQEATRKIGNLFQKQGVDVSVVNLPKGEDPDSLVRTQGIKKFIALLDQSSDYLRFLLAHHAKERDLQSPAGKSQIVQEIAAQIREWNSPLMVHESLRKLAEIAEVPEQMIGIGAMSSPNYMMRRSESAGLLEIDPDRILESDLLRWLLVGGPHSAEFVSLARKYVQPADLRVPICAQVLDVLYRLVDEQRPVDLLTLMSVVGDPECQKLLDELIQKRINKERGRQHLTETLQRILDRNWMERCEALRMEIQSGGCSDDEAMALLKEFDQLKRQGATKISS